MDDRTHPGPGAPEQDPIAALRAIHAECERVKRTVQDMQDRIALVIGQALAAGGFPPGPFQARD